MDYSIPISLRGPRDNSPTHLTDPASRSPLHWSRKLRGSRRIFGAMASLVAPIAVSAALLALTGYSPPDAYTQRVLDSEHFLARVDSYESAQIPAPMVKLPPSAFMTRTVGTPCSVQTVPLCT